VSPRRGVLYAPGMIRGPRRRPSRLALALLVLLPLVAVTALGYVALADPEAASPAVAQGVRGGVFHPVAGSFRPDETQLETCGATYACLQQGFGNLAYREGVRPALALFEARMATHEPVRLDCHRIAHVIGSAAFARFEGSVARSFAVGSPACASGYYHGILERAFVGVSTKARLASVARSLCVDGGIRRRGFLDYQCQHGLGHGLMIQTGYDLPVALSVCDALETGWDGVACAGGVFMENVTTRFGFRSQWLDDGDPFYPCAQVANLHRRSCYLRAAVRVLGLNGGSFATAADLCAALDARYAIACFRGYGREAAGSAKYDAAGIRRLCRLGGGYAGQCLYGAARTIADASGARGLTRAAQLCEGSRRAVREVCFEGVGIVVGLVRSSPGARARSCVRLAGPRAPACTRAANAEVHPGGRGSWG
jgi:hypothetical protein